MERLVLTADFVLENFFNRSIKDRLYLSTDKELLAKIEDYRWGRARWDRNEDKSRNEAIRELIILGLESLKARQ